MEIYIYIYIYIRKYENDNIKHKDRLYTTLYIRWLEINKHNKKVLTRRYLAKQESIDSEK